MSTASLIDSWADSAKEPNPDQRAADRTREKLETLTPVLPNGYMTISFPDGSHRTLRVRTQPASSKFAPGKRIIGLLIGPDNTADYEDFCFLTERGPVMWKRFANTKNQHYAELLWVLNKEPLDGYELVMSKRCLVCNRPLTDAESVRVGICPICRGG